MRLKTNHESRRNKHSQCKQESLLTADAFSEFYHEDEKGLHIRVTGMTTTGRKWTLREYQPQDFKAHWSIISGNMSTPTERKQYKPVDAATKGSVRMRRNRSLQRFKKGRPWRIMSLIDDHGKCVLIFDLGRRTGNEGLARPGHGHIGLTEDPQEEHNGYKQSFVKALTQELALEIRRLGESVDVGKNVSRTCSARFLNRRKYV